MMALTVAGAASFLTPIATPANLMVPRTGRLPLRRVLEARLPLAILFIVIAVWYVPLIWKF